MELDECNTLRECLTWAEGQWPGFWDFATLQPMSYDDVIRTMDLLQKIDATKEYQDFLDRFQTVAKKDRTEEGKYFLQKGAQSYAVLNRRLDEYYNTKFER